MIKYKTVQLAAYANEFSKTIHCPNRVPRCTLLIRGKKTGVLFIIRLKKTILIKYGWKYELLMLDTVEMAVATTMNEKKKT